MKQEGRKEETRETEGKESKADNRGAVPLRLDPNIDENPRAPSATAIEAHALI